MRRFLILFVLLPIAIVAVALSVANHAGVVLSLDPFGGAAPRWSVELPLFILLFATLGLGIVIGGVATWFGQGKWRRAARAERANAARLRQDVERLRERVTAGPALAPPYSDRDAA
jgi:uncharacterized protein HemY